MNDINLRSKLVKITNPPRYAYFLLLVISATLFLCSSLEVQKTPEGNKDYDEFKGVVRVLPELPLVDDYRILATLHLRNSWGAMPYDEMISFFKGKAASLGGTAIVIYDRNVVDYQGWSYNHGPGNQMTGRSEGKILNVHCYVLRMGDYIKK